MSFRIATDLFKGPIDLLLFLVRRHELDLTSIALARVTNQYIDYLDVLKEIEIDVVGDFIEVASLLIEMKARAMLPRNDFEEESLETDPRVDLVQRLLMYKQFRDAATLLEDQSIRWQHRYRRVADDLPPKRIDIADQTIEEVELWDLVSAFGRVLRENLPKPEENIVYDETPIQVYMQRIHARLVSEGMIPFSSLFQLGMHKSAMIGVFLAVLELARHHSVQTQQADLHEEIFVVPNEGFDANADFSDVDDYNPRKFKPGDPSELLKRVE